MHAQFSNWSDASEWRYKQSERWGQFKLRNPPNATLPPEHDSRRFWTSRPRRSCGARGQVGGREPRIECSGTHDMCLVFARCPQC